MRITMRPPAAVLEVRSSRTRLRSNAFRSLSNRNFRIYMAGQLTSHSGTWMQTVAQSWLVLTLTNSGTAVGFVTALQFLPVIVLGPLAGVLADRFPKKYLLLCTQVFALLQAAILGVLVLSGHAALWSVYVLAGTTGIITAIDNPVRQSFIGELVGSAGVSNAVSLNAVASALGRALGPAIAGVLIASVGIGVCFLVNAGTYLVVIASLLFVRTDRLHQLPRRPRTKGELREGLAYTWSTPEVAVPLIMLVLVGTFAYEFEVSLPLVADRTFSGGAGTLGWLTAAVGAGAVVGGVLAANRSTPTPRSYLLCTATLSALMVAAAAAPVLLAELGALFLTGIMTVNIVAMSNALLQLHARLDMRARVMALWVVGVLGSKFVGGPIIGFVGDQGGPRTALTTGAAGAGAAALVGWRLLPRSVPVTANESPQEWTVASSTAVADRT